MTYLFKAKVKNNGNHLFSGDWVQGSLIIKTNGYFIYVIEEDDLGNIVREFEVEVIPETVCSFVRRQDKNGNNIFEGDVIQNESGKYVIEYKTDYMIFGLIEKSAYDCGSTDELRPFVPLVRTMMYNAKIIGNIYDQI